MTIPVKQNLTIRKGKTFSLVTRWETSPIIYKAITGITNSAPVRITAAGHGIPTGWRAWVLSAEGCIEMNASSPVKDSQFHKVTAIDVNTIEFNDVNSADFGVYSSKGWVAYNTPVDLTDYVGRMQIKDKVGGTELIFLDDANSRITLDDTFKTITLTIEAADTEALTNKKGVYDLEMVNTVTGKVSALLTGNVSIVDEVTTAV